MANVASHRFLNVWQGNMQLLLFCVRSCAIVAHLQSKLEALFHRWLLQPKTKPLQIYGEASKVAELAWLSNLSTARSSIYTIALCLTGRQYCTA